MRNCTDVGWLDDKDVELCADVFPVVVCKSVCGRHLFSFPVSSHPATCCVAIQSNSAFQDCCLGNHVLYVRKLILLLLFHKRLIQEMSFKGLNFKAGVCVCVCVCLCVSVCVYMLSS